MSSKSPSLIKKACRMKLTTESKGSAGDDASDEPVPLRTYVKHRQVHQHCLALAKQA